MKSITVAISALAAACVHALNPILIKGNVFYDSVTKERFYLKAVDYQPLGEQGVDPLIDPEKCLRDLYLFQQLGLNAVRYDQLTAVSRRVIDSSSESIPAITREITMNACLFSMPEVSYIKSNSGASYD